MDTQPKLTKRTAGYSVGGSSGLATLDLVPNRRFRSYYDSRVSCFPLARTRSKSIWHQMEPPLSASMWDDGWADLMYERGLFIEPLFGGADCKLLAASVVAPGSGNAAGPCRDKKLVNFRACSYRCRLQLQTG